MKTNLKLFFVCIFGVSAQTYAQDLCSFRLMESPTGQKCLLIGERVSENRSDTLPTLISYFERVKLKERLAVVIGLQKINSALNKEQHTTQITEELERLTKASTASKVAYHWDVPWDEVRSFLQEVKADLFEYTTMFVTDRDMQTFYSLPERFVASNPPPKKPWTEVRDLYTSRRQLIQERTLRNKWYAFKVHEFLQHLYINLATLETLGREYTLDAAFSRIYEEHVLKPCRAAVASIEKVFKPLPKDQTLYEGIMGVFFDSNNPQDALRLVAYWEKIFERNTEFLFIAGYILNRFFKLGQKSLCCFANEISCKQLALILKDGFDWTMSQESVLIEEVTPLTFYKVDDALFEAKLLKAAGELIQSLVSHECVVCPKTQNVKQCSACKLIQYCSRECQTQDRPSHKTLCNKVAVKIAQTN